MIAQKRLHPATGPRSGHLLSDKDVWGARREDGSTSPLQSNSFSLVPGPVIFDLALHGCLPESPLCPRLPQHPPVRPNQKGPRREKSFLFIASNCNFPEGQQFARGCCCFHHARGELISVLLASLLDLLLLGLPFTDGCCTFQPARCNGVMYLHSPALSFCSWTEVMGFVMEGRVEG